MVENKNNKEFVSIKKRKKDCGLTMVSPQLFDKRHKENKSCMRKHLENYHKKGIKAMEEERKKQKGVGTSDEAQEAQKSNILTIVCY